MVVERREQLIGKVRVTSDERCARPAHLIDLQPKLTSQSGHHRQS
jgi:hypothetical protein